MLQQTQVATVIPYYTQWMEKFPTIRDLAAADIDTVNCLWKGLGYYSRAARLLAGAQKVVTNFSGRLPANATSLEKEIPGIGRYRYQHSTVLIAAVYILTLRPSAGAICSIAYGICAPVLDGNVQRLLSRVLALHVSPKAKKTLDILWDGAEAMVEGSDRPGDVNQALIELGSTVCKVRDPICESCPLSDGCRAYKESMVRNCTPLLFWGILKYECQIGFYRFQTIHQ
jgi:A/G-specific adenine glycosylase